MRNLFIGFFAVLALVSVNAQAANSLDELLDQVRNINKIEEKKNKQRERQFLNAKTKQKQLLGQAIARHKAEQRRGTRLANSFAANEKKIIEDTERLKNQSENLGEMFGVVRLVAGDLKAIIDTSLVSAQYPGRSDKIEALASAKELPTISELQQLWLALQTEMTEQSKVVTFRTPVTLLNGTEAQKNVTRIGAYNVISEGDYLNYNLETHKLEQLGRQPDRKYHKLVSGIEAISGKGGFARFAIDPTKGGFLSLLVQSPTLKEKWHEGGLPGYVITGLFAVGIVLAVYKLLYLFFVGIKVKSQLKSNEVKDNNPLGRILSVYHENKSADVENMELKLDEAILKETPRIESGLMTIKVLAAVSPLLGLLGTVVGMIATFQSIQLFGTGDPKLMAGGISQALVTTVLGLVSAIPLVLLHSVASGMSKSTVHVLEEQSAGMIAEHAEQGSN